MIRKYLNYGMKHMGIWGYYDASDITSSHIHYLKDYQILINNEYVCLAYSMGKLITKPS